MHDQLPRKQGGSKKGQLKHLNVLRKALSKANHTGEISYYTEDMDTGIIQVETGNMAADESTFLHLTKLLSFTIISCEFTSQQTNENYKNKPLPFALSRVLNDIHWSTDTLEEMRNGFSKLPPVTVKVASMHKIGFNDGLTYLSLYQFSQKENNFVISSFLAEQQKYTSLERQIKVLILGYCTGLINPSVLAVKKNKQVQKPVKKTTRRARIASMILMKIKGL